MIEAPEALRDAVLREALRGLTVPAGTQKSLSPWLFYDERGSELFLQITELPEYYLTRTERAIFEQYGAEIVQEGRVPVTIAELGAGTAAKTGILLRAMLKRQPEVLYQPIDVSASALDEAVQNLSEISGVMVHPKVANYVTDAYSIERIGDGNAMGLYIGSSLGNFGPVEAATILRGLRRHLRKVGDTLVLGVDLAPCRLKTVEFLLAAYDDAAGVTAEFNRNILVRLNREAGANFNLSTFAHRARWNALESRIEMHLESLIDQTVKVESKSIHFNAGETIHTENSYKFTERSLRTLLNGAGFGSPRWLHDAQHLFGVAIAHPG